MRDISSTMDRRALAANCESFPCFHMQTTNALVVGDPSCGVVGWSETREAGVKGGRIIDSRGVDGFASSSGSGMSWVNPS